MSLLSGDTRYSNPYPQSWSWRAAAKDYALSWESVPLSPGKMVTIISRTKASATEDPTFPLPRARYSGTPIFICYKTAMVISVESHITISVV
jgi:hypothetical protein